MNQRDAQFSGLLLVLAAAIASSFFATSAAAQSWDEVVKAAINEGEVVVHGAPGKVYEQVLTEGFRKAYLDIKLDFTGTSGRDVVEAILREREGGVFRWDVYVGGTPSILQTLKPAGAFAPLRPALILPEVVDSKLWRGGFDAGWMDKEKTYTYSFDLTMDPLIAINQDVVAPGAFTSFKDLLKPEFANKIVWDDPRLPGAGVLVGQTLLMNFGEDLLKQYFSTQKIVYSTNRRQQAEWVVSGTYPIGVATPVDEVGLFQAQGLGKNIVWFKGDLTKFAGDTALERSRSWTARRIRMPRRSISTGCCRRPARPITVDPSAIRGGSTCRRAIPLPFRRRMCPKPVCRRKTRSRYATAYRSSPRNSFLQAEIKPR